MNNLLTVSTVTVLITSVAAIPCIRISTCYSLLAIPGVRPACIETGNWRVRQPRLHKDGSPSILAYPCHSFCSLPPGGPEGQFSVCENDPRQTMYEVIPRSGLSYTHGLPGHDPNGWYAVDSRRVVSIRTLPDIRVITYYDQAKPEVIVVITRGIEGGLTNNDPDGFFIISPHEGHRMRSVDPGVGDREQMPIRVRGSMVVAGVDANYNMNIRRMSHGQLDLTLHVLRNEKKLLRRYLNNPKRPIIIERTESDGFGGQILTPVDKDMEVLHQCVSWIRKIMISSVITSNEPPLIDQENSPSLVNRY